MKIEFFENKYGISFNLTPETPEEVAMLARAANNASAQPVDVDFYFGDKPQGSVWIKKVKESAQRNSIGNKNRRRYG